MDLEEAREDLRREGTVRVWQMSPQEQRAMAERVEDFITQVYEAFWARELLGG